MPDFFTHTIFGLRVNDWLDVEMKMNLYNFANQGPDFFFYADFYPWKRQKRGMPYAKMLHKDKAKETLLEAIVYAKENYNDAIRTYLYGWINHYTLDSMTHPYVFEKEDQGFDHKEIEMAIDLHTIERFRFLPRYGPDLVALEDIDLANIRDIYTHVLAENFDETLPPDLVRQSYEDFVTYQKIFHDRENQKKKRLIRWVGRLFHLNLNRHYFGTTLEDLGIADIRRFDEAFDEAVLLAAQRCQAAQRFLDLKIDREELATYFDSINYEGERY